MAGRIQIETVGNKSLFPYTEPQFSYFSSLFKKHTCFARNNHHIKYNELFDFGNQTTVNVPQNLGDLLNRVILKVTLPQLPSIPGGYDANGIYSSQHDENTPGFQPVRIYYQESVGHALIEYIDFKIGNQTIERLTGETLQIHSEISDDEGCQVIHSQLINKYPYSIRRYAVSSATVGLNGSTPGSQVADAGVSKSLELLINIPFYFTKNPKLYIPLCSIYKQEISFDVKLRKFEDVIVEYIQPNYEEFYNNSFVPIVNWGVTKVNNQFQPYLNNMKIEDGEFIFERTFLDTIEKLKLKNSTIDILMTEMQVEEFNMNEELGKVPEKKFNLSFKNPVKELYFIIQRQNVDTGESNYISATTFNTIRGSTYVTPFNYDNSSDIHVQHQNVGDYDALLPNRPVSHSGTWDNLEYLKLTLDGNEVITRETGDFQTLGITQFTTHHKRTPQTRKIYMYSFALKPDEWEPSGHVNFSNIKNQILDVHLFSSETFLNRLTIPGTPGTLTNPVPDRWYVFPRVIRVYAKSYNILRVKDGIATKIF